MESGRESDKMIGRSRNGSADDRHGREYQGWLVNSQ